MNPLARTSLLLLALALGCGSKTGLRVPETEPSDDAGLPDAGMRDAGMVDSAIPPPEPEICVELPPREPPKFVDSAFLARIATADVLFLVDVTGSMQQEIDAIRRTLRDVIAPELIATIPDVQMAVAEFADFPEFPYGDPNDVPFRMLQESTAELSAVQTAVDRLPERSGSDVPESHTQALWHVATGRAHGRYTPPARCPEGTVGYPCFRARGSRIILLFTDAEFHQGPGDSFLYDDPVIRPEPARYDEAVDELRGIGAKVLGLFSGDFGAGMAEAHLRQIARDTGAVTPDGREIFEDIGSSGDRLGAGVVEVVRTLVEEVPIDISIEVSDYPGDGVDAAPFIGRSETTGATPRSGAIDLGDRFETVQPGTRVRFRTTLFNDSFPRTEEPQSYLLTITLVGDAVTSLQETLVEVVIPSLAGEGCER